MKSILISRHILQLIYTAMQRSTNSLKFVSNNQHRMNEIYLTNNLPLYIESTRVNDFKFARCLCIFCLVFLLINIFRDGIFDIQLGGWDFSLQQVIFSLFLHNKLFFFSKVNCNKFFF